jgi:hypothetical protein
MQATIDQLDENQEEQATQKVSWWSRITQKKSATSPANVTSQSAMQSATSDVNATPESAIIAHEKAPWYVTLGNAICIFLHYIFTGKWIVDLVRWMIDTGGNIAESAFLLATIYVTLNTVAHLLVSWVLPDNIILTLNQVSVIAFSVLPELIIFAALKTTYDHWKMVQATKRFDAWAWAIAYSIPTLIFLVMTILTITSFVSLEAINATAPQATGWMLVIRCLAGWGYGMVQILFAKIGKQAYANLLASYKIQVGTLKNALQERDATIQERETTIETQLKNIAFLQQKVADQDVELQELRVALASAKVAAKSVIENATKSDVTLPNVHSTFKNANVTPIKSRSTVQKSTSVHSAVKSVNDTDDMKFARLKMHLENNILQGGKKSLKQIALEANVSYGMARNRAQEIIEGLSLGQNSAMEIEA